MRFINTLIAVMICICTTMQVFASDIPAKELETLKQVFPELTVRFDGLVELSDGTQYLPVFPMETDEELEDTGKIIFTLPKEVKLAQKPDLIQFASNFSLFRIIRKPGENPTIIDSEEIPLEVKLGLLPQDLLVPHNLEIPTTLRIIMGDLVIPIRESGEFKELSFKKTANKPADAEKNVSLSKPEEINSSLKEFDSLINKDLYIINYDKNYVHVVNPEVGRPSKLFEIDSIPSDIKLTRTGRYFLVAALSRNKIYVIDAINGKYIKEISVGDLPISIALADRHHRAYVANKGDSTISVIDLKRMEVINTVAVEGMPVSLTLTEEQDEIVYYDSITNNIYSLIFTDDNYSGFINKQIASSANISKVVKHNGLLYVLSRTNGTLDVINPYKGSLEKSVKVGKKPVDLKLVKNKIYVLNAQDDSLSVIDREKLDVINTVALDTGGFPKNFDVMYNNKTAIITNASAYKMLIYNIEDDKVEKCLPLSVKVNSLVISNKLKQNENEDL